MHARRSRPRGTSAPNRSSARPRTPRNPDDFWANAREFAGDVVGDFAQHAVGELLERLTGRGEPLSSRQLPTNNRATRVRIALVGYEQCNGFEMQARAQEAMRFFDVEEKPIVLILETEKLNEHLVFLQFTVTVEWPAAQADVECRNQLAALVDGHHVLGYQLEILGVL